MMTAFVVISGCWTAAIAIDLAWARRLRTPHVEPLAATATQAGQLLS